MGFHTSATAPIVMIRSSDEVFLRSQNRISEGCGGMAYEDIRRSLSGADVIERSVPSTPYSRIPKGRIEDFRPELTDSIRVISDRIESLCRDMDGMDGDGVTMVREDMSTIIRDIDTVLRFSGPNDIHVMAKYHDDLAEWARPMLVVGRFLIDKNGASAQGGQ